GNGVDYSRINGQISVPFAPIPGLISVTPIEDNIPEPVETVVVSLIASNGYVIDGAAGGSATITITDNDNVFVPVAHLASPVGIDYHPQTQSLLVSYNYSSGEPKNFARIYTNVNVVVTNWSGMHGLT